MVDMERTEAERADGDLRRLVAEGGTEENGVIAQYEEYEARYLAATASGETFYEAVNTTTLPRATSVGATTAR